MREDMSRGELETERANKLYSDYLQRAHEADLSDIAAMNIVYSPGVDSQGRKIIVLVASHVPATTVDMDRILLFIIRAMDTVVAKPYVMVKRMISDE